MVPLFCFNAKRQLRKREGGEREGGDSEIKEEGREIEREK
jgi:hypothetical protein